MHNVVAVHGIVSEEVSKLEEDLGLTGILCPYGAVSDPYHILSGDLIDGNRFAISRQDLEFFKMDMDGVLPAVPTGEGPELSGILSRKRPDDVWIKEFSVDHPLSTRPTKIPSPRSYCGSSVGEREQCVRNLAVVLGSVTYSELYDIGGSDDLAGRAAAIDLLQAVLQIDLVSFRGIGEVYDHIHPLCYAKPDTLALEGTG